MSNILRTRTGTAVFGYPHEILKSLENINDSQRRASVNLLLRFILSQGKDFVRLTRQQIEKSTGLSRNAIVGAVEEINEHVFGATVAIVPRKGYRFTIMRQDANGKWLSYFHAPHISLDIRDPFAALVYDTLMSKMDRSGKTLLQIPYELSTDPQGRLVDRAIELLSKDQFIAVDGDCAEVLNPDTGKPMLEPVDAEEERLYFEDSTHCVRRLSNESLDKFFKKYFQLSLPDENVQAGQQLVRCPFHQDDEASMSLNTDTCQFNCHGCPAEGSTMVSFEMLRLKTKDVAEAWRSVCKKLHIKIVSRKGKMVSVHTYTDEKGEPLYVIKRYENGSSMSHFVNGKPVIGMVGVERTLYNLPAVLAANVVVICEGEKKADAVAALRLLDAGGNPVATTATGAWWSWHPLFAQYLQGKKVIIFPDYDHVGDKYLGAVEGTLRRRGIECLVVTFGDYGKDVRDLLKLHDDNTMKNALLTHVDSEWLEEGVTI